MDFSGTGHQSEGNINANFAITLSATLHAFRCLVPGDVPLNAGRRKRLSEDPAVR